MIKAVIFDCDGVLVDSEVLIHAIELEALAELGMHYESGPFKARFLGMSNPDYYAALDADAVERPSVRGDVGVILLVQNSCRLWVVGHKDATPVG